MMEKFDQKSFFDAFIKIAQYLAGLSPETDFWLHLGKAMHSFFKADVTLFGERQAEGVALHHCSSEDGPLCAGLFDKTQDIIAQVLGSGFLASEVVFVPEPYAVAILPIFRDRQVTDAILVAHRSADALPKEVLNVYLSVAGLAGTTLSKLASEQRLRRSQEELEKALEDTRKLSDELALSNRDLEQFAYITSHDLQEPLRAVALYVELLRERYQGRLDAEADEYIGFASEGARRLQDMIDDLLQYSRVGTRGNPFREVASAEALEQALIHLGPMIQDSGAVIDYGELPTVWGDESQLVLLFQNLVGNAIKFRSDEHPRIEILARRDGDWFVFAVKDNGIGIDSRFLERIFVIFERLHRDKYPGTGIGLAQCKRVVERHGGRIWAESELGQGAIFYFTLPAPPEERRKE